VFNYRWWRDFECHCSLCDVLLAVSTQPIYQSIRSVTVKQFREDPWVDFNPPGSSCLSFRMRIPELSTRENVGRFFTLLSRVCLTDLTLKHTVYKYQVIFFGKHLNKDPWSELVFHKANLLWYIIYYISSNIFWSVNTNSGSKNLYRYGSPWFTICNVSFE
jgi:hypothetical protein